MNSSLPRDFARDGPKVSPWWGVRGKALLLRLWGATRRSVLLVVRVVSSFAHILLNYVNFLDVDIIMAARSHNKRVRQWMNATDWTWTDHMTGHA